MASTIKRRAKSGNSKTNSIGSKLRYLRRIKRLTQRELAAKTGLSEQSIVALEAGRYQPKISTLRLLDEALGQQVETVVLDEAS